MASFICYCKGAQGSSTKQSHSAFRRNTDPVSHAICERPIDCSSLSNVETFTMERARKKEITLCPTGFKLRSSTCGRACASATAKATAN